MKTRIDVCLTNLGFATSRNKARGLVQDGLVFVDGKQVDKVSALVDDGQKIEVKEHDQYVSRGAYKLLGALQAFDINLENKVVLDIGASTGGFTQVALQKGAAKVFALDIGKSELDLTLAQNPRVVNLSNVDIRDVDPALASDVDFLTCDLSFISLSKVLGIVFERLGKKEGVFLFKPQFECGRELAKKFKGVIKDQKVHQNLLKNFVGFVSENGLTLSGLTYSPITGGDGNIEYLFHLNGTRQAQVDIESVVKDAFAAHSARRHAAKE